MKSFLSKALVFFIILSSFLSLVEYMIDRGLQKSNALSFGSWNEIRTGDLNSDLLINGASRAASHVDPFVLDTILDLNSYNLGIRGHNFYLQYYKYNTYLKYNKKPNIIVQTVDINTLAKRKDLFDYEQFLPYLDDEVHLAKPLISYEGIDSHYFNIPFYKYIGEFKLIGIGLSEFLGIKKVRKWKMKGFYGNPITWNGKPLNDLLRLGHTYETEIDPESLVLFENFLIDCKSNNISVILVSTPMYYRAQEMLTNDGELMNVYEEFSKRLSIPYLDYFDSHISYDSTYFGNHTHLNKSGAEVFTRILGSDLKKLLIDNES